MHHKDLKPNLKQLVSIFLFTSDACEDVIHADENVCNFNLLKT